MEITRLIVGPIGTNCYVVRDEAGEGGIVIDPGGDVDEIVRSCREKGLEPTHIVNTHAHGDHSAGDTELKAAFPQAKLCVGPGGAERLRKPTGNLAFMMGFKVGAPVPDLVLSEGDELAMGACVLRVIESPGHAPESICLIGERDGRAVVFCGDVIFQSGVGRVDLPGGDAAVLRRTIAEKVFTLPDDTVLLSGHGEPTTVAAEKSAGLLDEDWWQ